MVSGWLGSFKLDPKHHSSMISCGIKSGEVGGMETIVEWGARGGGMESIVEWGSQGGWDGGFQCHIPPYHHLQLSGLLATRR